MGNKEAEGTNKVFKVEGQTGSSDWVSVSDDQMG